MKNKVLTDYITDNLKPLKSERDRIQKLYEELCGFLGHDSCFQTGSYARFTAVRPVKDLDIFYVLGSGTTVAGVQGALARLAADLEAGFAKICSEDFKVEIQEHSIKLQFSDNFSIDVVPAIETGRVTHDLGTPIYIVPNEKSGQWIHSDPKGYKELIKRCDEASNKNPRRAIRFAKGWRRGCKDKDDDFKLKSFHVEQILVEIFQESPEIELFDAVKKFFSDLPSNFLRPRFKDRADESIFIDQYVGELTPTERNQVIGWSNAQLRRLEQMEHATTEAEMLSIIHQIMVCEVPSISSVSYQAPIQQTSFTPAGPHSM